MDSGLRFLVLRGVKEEARAGKHDEGDGTKIPMKELPRESICKKEAVTGRNPRSEGAIRVAENGTSDTKRDKIASEDQRFIGETPGGDGELQHSISHLE